MNLQRLEEFEGRLQSKDEEIDRLKEKYAKIKGDFGYNLKLLEAGPRFFTHHVVVLCALTFPPGVPLLSIAGA